MNPLGLGMSSRKAGSMGKLAYHSTNTLILIGNGAGKFGAKPMDKTSIPRGTMICGECFGDPMQYAIDFLSVCPTCHGLGYHDNPDYIPGWDEGDVIDPIKEYGTLHAKHGRMA